MSEQVHVHPVTSSRSAPGTMSDDAEKEGEGPRCVGCGSRVKTLFIQYSPGNIRLMKCDNCKAVADPYIECEFMIILIDLILHKTRAYRHLLFNKLAIGSSVEKGILYQSILMHIVLDAFRISFSKGNKADGDSSRSMLFTIFSWSEVLGDALLGNIIFTATLFLGIRFILKLCYDFTRYREVLLSVIISSYFKLFLLTMMVWDFPSSAIFIVEIFVLSSNVVALRVATQFPKPHCLGVCFAAHAAKHLTERWFLRAPCSAVVEVWFAVTLLYAKADGASCSYAWRWPFPLAYLWPK